MSSDTPDAPDYVGAAEATSASDQAALEYQTNANRPNQNTPFGSVEWTQDRNGNWTQNTTLNDTSQRSLDAELELGANRNELGASLFPRMEAEFGETMDWSTLPEVGSGAGARDRAEGALYGRSASYLDPQWEQAGDQKMAQLVAQGLRPGDQAYDQAMENMSREKAFAYNAAQDSAIIGGGAEADRQYNLESSDRNRQLAEEMTKRGFSLNEINAIISGQQTSMPGMPGFESAGRGQGTDYSGAAGSTYNAASNDASIDNYATNSMMSGLMGMGGMAMMCDRRLKRNVTRIGTFKHYPLYLFQYIWGKWAVGPMADEVNQDAVTRLPNGFDMVDLTRVR